MLSTERTVVITTPNFDQRTIEYLAANNCRPKLVSLAKPDRNLTTSELCEILEGADGWIVGHALVDKHLINRLPALKVISRRGVGYERIDLAAAEEAGLVVTIGAGGNEDSVADHTVGFMLSAARRFREFQARMAKGDWSVLVGSDLYQKTVGIIGFGRIGRSVARRLAGFDARILVCTPKPDEALGRRLGVTYVGMPELLAESDFITLHTPYTPDTRFMIDADAISRMKKGAILVNTARGGVVEDAHLLKALQDQRIAGAGLDVFVSEADPAYAEVTKALLDMPTVVVSAHAAASSREGLDRTNMIAAQSVVAVFDGKSPAAECVVADGRVRV